ncbi:hypothetical protein RJZ56_004986 [Blastomyces dermatitidis]
MWGNGAAAARVLAANGAKVFVCDLHLSVAQHTQRRIEAEAGECTVMSADVTKDADVTALVDACLARYGGRIDILVNNVGRSEPAGPAEMSEQSWDSQTTEGGGPIVNVSSIAGMRYIGKPQVAYSAMKAAVIQFTKTTAVIYAKKGVRLNVVVPGLIHSPLVGLLAEKYAGGDLEGFVEKRHQACTDGEDGRSV